MKGYFSRFYQHCLSLSQFLKFPQSHFQSRPLSANFKLKHKIHPQAQKKKTSLNRFANFFGQILPIFAIIRVLKVRKPTFLSLFKLRFANFKFCLIFKRWILGHRASLKIAEVGKPTILMKFVFRFANFLFFQMP